MAIAKEATPLILEIDDGSKLYQLRNRFGEAVGEFVIRPSDLGMFERLQALQEKLDGIIDPLKEIDIGADGQATDAQGLAALAEVRKRLYEAIDELFASDMAGRLFGKMHPFSPVGGRFYFERVLEAVGAQINAEFEEEAKRTNERVERYVREVE